MEQWTSEDGPKIKDILKHTGGIGGAVAAFLVVILVMASVTFIPAGNEGVKFNVVTGKIDPITLKQGWQFRLPLVTKVIVYDCRRKDYTMSANPQEGQYKGLSDTNWSPTSDGNSVGLDVTVWYRIPENSAGKQRGPNAVDA